MRRRTRGVENAVVIAHNLFVEFQNRNTNEKSKILFTNSSITRIYIFNVMKFQIWLSGWFVVHILFDSIYSCWHMIFNQSKVHGAGSFP